MERAIVFVLILLHGAAACSAGTIGIKSLPSSPVSNNPVCYNSAGVLSRCPVNPLAGASVLNLAPVSVDSKGVAVGTFLVFFCI